MKLYDIFRTANANIFRSKLRTSLTIIAIFIGAFTLTVTNGIGNGISSYIDTQLNNLGAKNVLIITPASGATSSSSAPKEYDPTKKVVSSGNNFEGTQTVLTNADIAKIKTVEGLSEVTPQRGAAPNFINGPNNKPYLLSVTEYFNDSKLIFDAGGPINNTATGNEVILPASYVSVLGFANANEAIGKTVVIGVQDATGQQYTFAATVKGVQQKGLAGGSQVVANTTLLDTIFNHQVIGLPADTVDSYSSATAIFDNNQGQAHEDQLKQSLKDKGFKAVTIEDQIGTFKSVVKGIILVLNLFAIIALLAASFGIVNTLLMSVQERTKEIGLMKAMGMSSSKIFLLFSTEAVTLGFWGSLIGVIVAEVAGRIANNIVGNGLLKDLPGLELLSFPILSVLSVIGLVMVIALLAGTLPAWRAARQSPIDSLRYE